MDRTSYIVATVLVALYLIALVARLLGLMPQGIADAIYFLLAA